MFNIKSVFIIYLINSLNTVKGQTVSSIINGEVQTLRDIHVKVAFGEQAAKLKPTNADKNAATKAIKEVNAILEEPTLMNLTSLNPLIINNNEKIKIDVGNLLFAQIAIEKVIIKGLNNIEIKEAEFDIKNLGARSTVTAPRIIIDADYEMHSQILLSFPYNPKGHIRLILHNTTWHDVQIGLRNQDSVVQIYSAHGDVYIQRVQGKISGLKNGPYKMIQATNLPLEPLLSENKAKIAEYVTTNGINSINNLLKDRSISEADLVNSIRHQFY